MSKKDKLLDRLRLQPKDFTFDELCTLLGSLGYYIVKSGKTGGSRVTFSNGEDYIRLHKPHPRNILKSYQIYDIITILKERGLIMKPSNYISHKGYTGSVEFSAEDAVFHGKVIGIKSLISFEGDSVASLTEDFFNAVDEYLQFCKENGKEPEKPFKGSFNVRIGPDLHRKAATAASAMNMSLNAYVEEAIRRVV